MVKVKEILQDKSGEVAHIDQEASVLDATRLMNERRIGSVVVCEGPTVKGIFTERDVLCRVVAEARDPAATRLREVMSSPVACCTPDTSMEECAGVMTEKRIRHLPVVEGDRLVGIVTSGDILAREKQEHMKTIKYLKEYLYGPM